MPDGTEHRRQSHPTIKGGLDLLYFCGLIALCAAVVSGLAWTRPTEARGGTPYTQQGKLTYSGPTPSTSIYGPAGLKTGQPIYWSVLTTVAVTYRYRFSVAAPARVRGTEQLVASMSNGEGVTRTLPLQPPTAFTGAGFVASGILQRSALELLARVFDQAAGTSNGGSYTVTIAPHVRVRGRLDGLPLHARFSPVASFTLEQVGLFPATASGGTSAAGSGTSHQQFIATAAGEVPDPAGRSAVLFLGIPVLDARIGGLVLLGLALAALGVLGLPMLGDVTSADERVRIASRFSGSIEEADAIPVSPSQVVEMSTFQGVANVARRLECPILHVRHDGSDVYAVVDNGTVYRYRSTHGQPAPVGRMTPGGGMARHAAAGRTPVAAPARVS